MGSLQSVLQSESVLSVGSPGGKDAEWLTMSARELLTVSLDGRVPAVLDDASLAPPFSASESAVTVADRDLVACARIFAGVRGPEAPECVYESVRRT